MIEPAPAAVIGSERLGRSGVATSNSTRSQTPLFVTPNSKVAGTAATARNYRNFMAGPTIGGGSLSAR